MKQNKRTETKMRLFDLLFVGCYYEEVQTFCISTEKRSLFDKVVRRVSIFFLKQIYREQLLLFNRLLFHVGGFMLQELESCPRLLICPVCLFVENLFISKLKQKEFIAKEVSFLGPHIQLPLF